MIEKPTVLVLGAGASAHLGYPLGRGLVSELCSLRSSPALDQLPNWTRADAEDVLTALSLSDPSSIDAFLEHNPNHSALGRFLIAQALKSRERLEQLFPPGDAGWYRYLFDELLVDGQPQLGENPITLITFNYDRSIEAYIYTRLRAQFRLAESDALAILRSLQIIRPHGILGEFPAVAYDASCSREELLNISQQIKIIHELGDSTPRDGSFCNDAFREAHSALVAADRVFFLGFGFHTDNLRRMGAFAPATFKGKQVFATSHGTGRRERDALVEKLVPLGFPGVEMFTERDCNGLFRHFAGLE